MATREQLETALRNADAAATRGEAGAADDARQLAQALKAMGAGAAPKAADDPSLWEGGRVPSTDPTQGVSDGQRFAAGAGKSLRDTGLGVVQFIAGGGPYAALMDAAQDNVRQRGIADVVSGGLGARHPLDLAGRAEDWATRRVMDNRSADRALTDTGAGFAGNLTGVVAQMLMPAGAMAGAARTRELAIAAPALNAGVRALMPTSVKGAALQGGAFGATQPLGTDDSRVANTGLGALAGTVGGAAPRVLGAGLRSLNRILEPLTDRGVENITGRTIQRFAQNPAALQQLSDPILGRAPTLAEATLDPGIAQLQRAAMSRSPEVATALHAARTQANEARIAAMQKFAGDPAKRQAALEAIEKAENAAYASVRQVDGVDIAPVTARIDAILAGPEGKRKAVRQALAEAREALMREDGTPETSANMLLGARGAIRDLLEGRGENQAGKLAQRELIAVREALDEAIRKVAPQIDQALDARRLGMRPVNEMDAMDELLKRGTGTVTSPTGTLAMGLQPSAMLRAGDDLERVARAGTGFRKAGEDVFSPQAQQTIEGVRVGLARQQFADNAAKVPGSPTAQFLAGQNIMEALTGQKPGVMSGLARLGAAALDKPYAFVGVPQRLESAMARVLTNPQEAQAILSRLPPPDRALVEQAIGRLSAPAGAAVGVTNR